MIRHARAAAQGAGLPITYHEQDMRQLTVPAPVDLVTCMYDSLNFMTTVADLRSAFAAARRVLRDGGRYVFDMYTPAGLAELWGSTDAVHTVHPDHFVASRTRWDPATTTNTKTLWGFDRTGATWASWTERHTLRAYPHDELTGLLSAVGFRVDAVHGWTGTTRVPLAPDTHRIVAVATAT